MLLEHPRIYLDASGRTTDALRFASGRVVAVGDEARKQWRASTDERRETPDGACLFPALADAHCHLWGLGRRAESLDLSGAASSEEVLDALRTVSPEALPTDWIFGRGWDDHHWPEEDRLTRRDLDAVAPERPVCLHRVDNHALVVNTEALERAGWRPADDPEARALKRRDGDGRVERGDDGSPTGLLVDEAMEPVLEAVPDPGVDEDRRMFEEAARRYRRMGIASAHLAKVDADRLEMLRDMARSGELPLRIYAMVDGEHPEVDPVLERGPRRDPDTRLSIGAIKYFADGALGSGGALLMEPDRRGNRGLEVVEAAELGRRAEERIEQGWQVAVHAIGDRGARHVLDAFERAPAAARRRVRPRLEHAQMLTRRDCERLASLDTIASIQPIHLRSDAAWADERLHEAQLDRLFPWRSLAEHATLAAGSDFPIEDPNPWHGMATALSRRDARGRAFRPERSLGREEILAAYTTGAARAAHWEGRLGRLAPGYAADAIALDRDPFWASPASIWETEVLETWIGGTSVTD